jgi:hypothetical protein
VSCAIFSGGLAGPDFTCRFPGRNLLIDKLPIYCSKFTDAIRLLASVPWRIGPAGRTGLAASPSHPHQLRTRRRKEIEEEGSGKETSRESEKEEMKLPVGQQWDSPFEWAYSANCQQ